MPNEMSLLKSLYELSEDPKRKEFLDDLFSFMQKRGTPVNRIPIMAKQTLDLYELFRLVVSKGGLVEVINKKLWREITKGLNLPSSITSAAFTLRTQYMKYLYPYECEKLKLSSPQELQAAIDGNRREGRRPSYGYDLSPGPTLIPNPHHHLNGNILNGKLGATSPGAASISSMKSEWLAAYSSIFPTEARKKTGLESSQNDDDSMPSTPLQSRSLSERDALAMEAASRAMEEATRKMEAASRAAVEESPPRKRLAMSEEERLLVHAGMPSAHIKITNDGRSEIDNSLVAGAISAAVANMGVLVIGSGGGGGCGRDGGVTYVAVVVLAFVFHIVPVAFVLVAVGEATFVDMVVSTSREFTYSYYDEYKRDGLKELSHRLGKNVLPYCVIDLYV
ncbi:AT-rich interactive domain-containing protein 3C-like isoform X3 [Octopus vulgaris]|uniref:AT-rich interactive domain-containing protein 3C-like isoform X3 n=1 Tax=Octopus vulgaris TaxID=6645 RepID=A0AA36F1Q0_OCTVU|nr:AT-rich interactive domain-containing protein 3C-like isoform X3 [Octopus vulgaris]